MKMLVRFFGENACALFCENARETTARQRHFFAEKTQNNANIKHSVHFYIFSQQFSTASLQTAYFTHNFAPTNKVCLPNFWGYTIILFETCLRHYQRKLTF
ncbi:MAG: hypothetical protein ACI4QH_00885 [Candidatus Fimimonas sp.]